MLKINTDLICYFIKLKNVLNFNQGTVDPRTPVTSSRKIARFSIWIYFKARNLHSHHDRFYTFFSKMFVHYAAHRKANVLPFSKILQTRIVKCFPQQNPPRIQRLNKK